MDSRQELIEELAAVFGQQSEAEELLEEIRYPRGLRPRWPVSSDAARYWAHVVAGIEDGRLPGSDLELLAVAACGRHPENRVFLQAAGHGWRRLRTYADQPVVIPRQDAFGFLEYADVFSILINDEDTATPLTVAVSGPWGSGKTSLAQLVEDRLRVRLYWRRGWRRPPISCWFNAWMHSDAQYLGAALAASVTRQVSRRRRLLWRLVSPLPSVMLSPEQRAWRRVWTGFVAASIALTAVFVLLRFFPGLRPESGRLGQLYGHWQVLTVYAALPAVIALFRSAGKVRDTLGAFIDSPRSAAAQGTLDEVNAQLGRVIRQAQRCGLGRAKRRVVIFIDDLERCPMDKALDICEVVSQLLSHADVITVLVADLDLLELAADTRFRLASDGQPAVPGFPEIGKQYLHKLIQFRFNLPPLDQAAVASALALAGQPDSSDLQPGGMRNRYEAARKWASIHQIALGIASLAAALSVGAYFVASIYGTIHLGGRAASHSPARSHDTSSHAGGSSHASSVIGSVVHVFGSVSKGISEAIPDAIAGSAKVVGYILSHPPLVLAITLAALGYQLAKGAISRVWVQRHPMATGSSTEIHRLEEYDLSRDVTESEIAPYLPSNLRSAKRLVNHERLYALIGEYRGIFGGDPELTHRHLAKWVLIIEHWPRLGAALTREPAMMNALEEASNISELQAALDLISPGSRADDELFQVLQYGTSLSPVLARLVRFEAPRTQAGTA